MSNILRRDPFDDLFRGFFVRPVSLGNENTQSAETPAIPHGCEGNPEAFLVHAELPG